MAFGHIIYIAAIGAYRKFRHAHISPLLQIIVDGKRQTAVPRPRQAGAKGRRYRESIGGANRIAHKTIADRFQIIEVGLAVNVVTKTIGEAERQRVFLADRLHILQTEISLIGMQTSRILATQRTDGSVGERRGDGMIDIAPEIAEVGAHGKSSERFPTDASISYVQAAIAFIGIGLRNFARLCLHRALPTKIIAYGRVRQEAEREA